MKNIAMPYRLGAGIIATIRFQSWQRNIHRGDPHLTRELLVHLARSAPGMKKPRPGNEMLVNEMIQVAADGEPPINGCDYGIDASTFFLSPSPVGIPALWILQWPFGLEHRRRRRRNEKALRMPDTGDIKPDQSRSATQRLGQGHLGTAVGSRGQSDRHLLDRESVSVEDKQALKKERISVRP